MNDATANNVIEPVDSNGKGLGSLVSYSQVKWHLIFAMIWLCVALFAGLFYSLQLIDHDMLPDAEILSRGRIRMIHTNLIAFGFLTNGFFAMLNWAVPRLTGQPTASRKLGWVILAVWNATIALVWGMLHFGYAQGVEWGETPHLTDHLIVVGAVLVAIQFYTPIVKTKERALYVSLWYFSAAFVWLALTYLMGNYMTRMLPGNEAGPLLGLYIHDLVGLWVTPMGWGMMYFFVPIILRKPVWSHALSLVGFWGLAFFYPLQGVHHFLGSPIPMFAQYSAIVSTIAIEIVVTTVVINFFMTWRGSSVSMRDSFALRWFWIGALNYFITCLQCAFQVTLTFQQIIHFTDWVVGHAHLVMFGVFSFWIFGMTMHLWPKLTGREWYSRKLAEWQFWLIVIGLEMMFLTLTAGGLVDGFMSRSLSPRVEILVALKPFWIMRTFTGLAIIGGFGCLVTNMWLTARSAKARPHVDEDYAPYEQLEEEAVATAG
jgi:cytochrome c oxidase cbb3-type subunit 1